MNWMKFRWFYFLVSGIVLAFSVYAIATWGFRPSIDFTGGSVVEYRFQGRVEASKVSEDIVAQGYELKEVKSISANSLELKFVPTFEQRNAEDLSAILAQSLKEKPEIVRFETVGPALSTEILEKTYIAIAIAATGILLWVAWQFKSIQFGISAILATLHDTIILLGVFAVLGHYKGVEVDILFVTAVLTTLSFSVHDTIVVYDRIRESKRRFSSVSFVDLSNKAVTETMGRSLNNSLTIIFMLLALFLMGGVTIKWFVAALLVGTISGTYSSPFVAVPLLVMWDWIRGRF
ncbi:MAG: protein translocase subunit SecF [Candidatus Blackburnbacteria bacterium]|nr:protein translocase subunit SecF [Candidatus Blackburnbacteria bacterium]